MSYSKESYAVWPCTQNVCHISREGSRVTMHKKYWYFYFAKYTRFLDFVTNVQTLLIGIINCIVLWYDGNNSYYINHFHHIPLLTYENPNILWFRIGTTIFLPVQYQIRDPIDGCLFCLIAGKLKRYARWRNAQNEVDMAMGFGFNVMPPTRITWILGSLVPSITRNHPQGCEKDSRRDWIDCTFLAIFTNKIA